jgi:ATP-binding cassette, subfamily B, bacterial
VLDGVPQGLETQLGTAWPGGVELSGGQWQKLALGRGMMGNDPLLVSHRFSTVRMADLIVVLDGGQIREHGSHQKLMDIGGLNAELYELQSRAYR